MKVIRPIAPKDLKAFETFAYTMTYGMTSLPKNPDLLREKIEKSQRAFSEQKGDPLHIFVLEDEKSGQILGTSAIRSKTGVNDPEYFYRLEQEVRHKATPHVSSSMQILKPISESDGPTEICGLYLLPEARKAHLGRLLSYSRFLFIASHPKRFTPTLWALMRGVITETGACPFWDCVGRPFFQASLEQVENLAVQSKKFIPHILPSYPLYLDLLPKEVQETVGKTHKNTEAALHLLLKEGFNYTDEIDVIDGGPRIAAFTHEIRTIRDSRVATVYDTVDTLDEAPLWLIGTLSLNYRAVIAPLHKKTDEQILLSREAAQALKVKPGDKVRYVLP